MEKDDDELKFENELEKLKLQGEFGAKFFSGGGNIPPEMEAEWLKNVREFEESYNNAPEKTIAEILGNPVLTPVSEIKDENIAAELDNLCLLLAKHSIIIDHDEDVPAREIYRFITEEALGHKTYSFSITGMTNHIIYEEFYPNHYKDIIRSCENFSWRLFDQSVEHLDMELDDVLVFSNNVVMPKEKFIEKAVQWFANYEDFELQKLLFMKPEFNLEQSMGHVNTYFKYEAKCEDGSILNFDGPGIFYLHYLYGYWHICGMDFPGFKEWAFI